MDRLLCWRGARGAMLTVIALGMWATSASAQTSAAITTTEIAAPKEGITELVAASDSAVFALFTPNDGSRAQSLLRIDLNEGYAVAAAEVPSPVRVVAATAGALGPIVATAAVVDGVAGQCALQAWDGATGTLGRPVAIDDAPTCAIQLERLPDGSVAMLNRDRGTVFAVNPETLTTESTQPTGIPDGYQISELLVSTGAVAALLSPSDPTGSAPLQVAAFADRTVSATRAIERLVGRTPSQVLVIADGAPIALDLSTLAEGQPAGGAGTAVVSSEPLTWTASAGPVVRLEVSSVNETLATHELAGGTDGPTRVHLVAAGTHAAVAITTLQGGEPTTTLTAVQFDL